VKDAVLMRVLTSPVATVPGTWQRQPRPEEWPKLQLTHNVTVDIIDNGTKVIATLKDTGVDQMAGDNGALAAGKTTRVEVWNNGERTEQFDVVVPPPAVEADPVPFGYQVHVGGELLDMTFERSFQTGEILATYKPGAPASQPTPQIRTGSYRLIGAPTLRLDVYPNGRAVLFKGDEATPCYPDSYTQASPLRVSQCSVLADNVFGAGRATFTSHVAADSPDVGFVSIGVINHALYPF
jgi:hypothetical protein